MQRVLQFIKVTISGGVLLLLPLIFCLWAFSKVIGFLRKVVEPIAHHFPFQIAGLAKETIVSILLLLVLCFLAGIFMRSDAARWLKHAIRANTHIRFGVHARKIGRAFIALLRAGSDFYTEEIWGRRGCDDG